MYNISLYTKAMKCLNREELEFLLVGAMLKTVQLVDDLENLGYQPDHKVRGVNPVEAARVRELSDRLSAELRRLRGG